MEEIIKEKPANENDYWLNLAKERIESGYEFYQLRYSFTLYSYVVKLSNIIKQHDDLSFFYKKEAGMFICTITKHNNG